MYVWYRKSVYYYEIFLTEYRNVVYIATGCGCASTRNQITYQIPERTEMTVTTQS